MHSHRTRTLTTGTARGVRRRRPTTIAAVVTAFVVTAVALLASVQASTPTMALAPPQTDVTTTLSMIAAPRATTTTSSTTTTSPQVIALPATTTTRPTTSTTTTTTSAPPAVQVATTAAATTAPVIAQQPPPTTTAPAAPTDVAVSTTTTTQPVQLSVPTTAPPSTDEQVTIGEWSTDPADWSPEMLQYLQAEGLDPDALANQGATVGGPSDQLLSNEGCAVNCITSGLMWAVGVGAYLEVTTSVPAFIQIEILDVGLKFGPPSAKIWGATWAHLEPGTTYQAVARAHDAQGNMAVASGEFTTATRHAMITFEPTVFWFGNVPDFDPWGSYLWSNHAYGYLNGIQQSERHRYTASDAVVRRRGDRPVGHRGRLRRRLRLRGRV